jgi:hypothetical protein
MGPEARSRACNLGNISAPSKKKMKTIIMLNSFFSLIPNRYWLGNHKILKADGHFMARK